MSAENSRKVVDAIGMLELRSIARAIETGDAMLKAADVILIQSTPVCSGKYIILIGGAVADVQASLTAGKEVGKDLIIDELLIPNVHPDVFPALMAATRVEEGEAVGVIETLTCAAGIVAADRAAKTGKVKLMEIRIARGLGGKAYVTLTGEVSAVRAGVEAGAAEAAAEGLLVQSVVIPSIHPRMLENLL
ncbi:BMC domain-containing protein [Candidatus Sumerlaeota bacterium]|nr:BMC domain-containing protein [Candidatus Sumerlaeota bacterium]